MNETNWFVVFSDDVYVVGKNVNTIHNKPDALLVTIKEVCLEMKTEKIK